MIASIDIDQCPHVELKIFHDREAQVGDFRLRAVSLFSWSVEQNARDTQMTTCMTEGATLARACTPLSKSEEKERLLAV